jgi:hypothetical protein
MTEWSSPGFYADYRLGGVRRIVYSHPEDLMRVPEEILECVCFLCTESSGGKVALRGTAFFVSVPAERIPNGSFTYLVTARHNIRKAEAVGDQLVLRVNMKEGGAETAVIEGLRWFYPANEASDIAVSSPVTGLEEYGVTYRRIPRTMFATDDVIAEKHIGVGDELISTGLFVHHYGRRKNVPIIRSGNIAAMPGEPLLDPDSGLDYQAYLAEIRSIGGLSGSPVFVELGIGRQFEGSVNLNQIQRFLLGVVRGHWNKDEFDSAADFGTGELEELNSGIAVVTPITEALKIIDGEDFVKERKQAEREHLKKNAPTDDSANIELRGDAEFERFEDLARKLVNTPKSEIDEKRKERESQ